jgi:hypothetical protein
MQQSESSNSSRDPADRRAGRKKTQRDLTKAVTLRPREVFILYGMPVTTVSDLCNLSDPVERIDSYKIAGRCGRKGGRYIDHAKFKLWLERHRCQ